MLKFFIPKGMTNSEPACGRQAACDRFKKKYRHMKKMTCNQLGGACELEFHANTFEEIEEMSKKHGMEMFQKGDQPHLDAMNKMREMMCAPDDMKKWFEGKRKEFEGLPEL